MSRIDDLIAKHCPNGVEFSELQDVFDTRNGYTPSTTNKAYWTNGTVPWFRMEDIRANGRVLSHSLQSITKEAVKGSRLFPANSIIVATSATIGEHALITVPHLSNQRFTSLFPKQKYVDKLDMKFIYYYCFILDRWCLGNTTKSSFSSVDMAGFKKFKFPIPPLPVQQEIVRVLDNFTALEAELEAELEARRKQYSHYRDALLTFSEDTTGASKQASIRRMTLGSIAKMRAGEHIQAIKIASVADGTHAYPCYGGNGVRGFVEKYSHDGRYILIGRQGALCGNVKRTDGKFYATEHAVVASVINDVDINWAFHVLTHMNLNQYASKSAQPGLAVGNLEDLIVCVPPLEEQQYTAAILDKFDALVNDLSQGLPAEIAARRQQYEHYRDRLLTFKEAA